MATIMYFLPFVIVDDRCQAVVNRVIVWNCEHFLSLLEQPNLILTEKEFRPRLVDNSHILLGGWKFDIHSTIFPSAKSEEVVRGWNMLNEDIRNLLDRLFQPFFLKAVKSATIFPINEFSRHEPQMIELLRLGYWYYICSNLEGGKTFPSKRKEIRGKLSRKLLFHLDQYKVSIKGDFPEELQEFVEKLNEAIPNSKNNAKSLDEDFPRYMKELPTVVWSITSELMFAGISSKYGSKVTFDPHADEHDYDFIINGVPSQVKTIIPDESCSRVIEQKINNRLKEWNNGRRIEQAGIEDEILSFLRENDGVVTKAIEQKVRIINVNGTQTYAGFLLNQWAVDNNFDITIDKALQDSMNILRENSSCVPLLFGASSIDYYYRFSVWSYRATIEIENDIPRPIYTRIE
jgi:hypothetical protein